VLAGGDGSFVPISLAAPAIHVDTTEGYDPDLATIVAFVNPPAGNAG
jgi:hypothetical protein